MDDASMNPDVFAPLPPEGTEGASTATSAVKDELWEPTPWPLTVPAPKLSDLYHGGFGKAVAAWSYHDADSALLFVVARFQKEVDGETKKDVTPFCHGHRVWKDRQGQQRDRTGWHMKAPPKPRPLYNLHLLAQRPEAAFLIVEGEKTAEAAAKLFPDHVAITWQGGGNAVALADWSPLAGRSGAMWPDRDEPGEKAAAAVVKAARAAGVAAVTVVPVPADWPEGWDVADEPPEGVTPEGLAVMLATAADVAEDEEGEAQAEEAPATLDADLDRAALMTDLAWEMARIEMARRHRVRVTQLDAQRIGRKAALRAEERRGAGPAEVPKDPRGRASLYIDKADLPDVAAELAEHLAESPRLFDRGGPCRLTFDAQRGMSVAVPLTFHGVITESHAVVRPYNIRKTPDGDEERQNVTLPEAVAKLWLDNRGGQNLRPLDGVSTAPLLHGDGSIHAVDGYDARSRLWCERVPHLAVRDEPSREHAEKALLFLRRHLRTFAFADSPRVEDPDEAVPVVDVNQPPGMDESTALVGLLTAVCRPSLQLSPAMMVRAAQSSGSGAGKGLLFRGICAAAFGSPPSAMSAGHDPGEFDKRITAALIEAAPVLFLDNLNATALRSDVLASAITERPCAVRPMGQSSIVLLNPMAFIGVTGNGLILSEDLVRRFFTVDLDPGVENPEARTFRGDFVADTLAKRKTLLEAVLTIWRWGRLQGDALPSGAALGSFGQWGRWVRDPLMTLGCKDPVERIQRDKANDPHRQSIARIFQAWWTAHGNLPMSAASLCERVLEEINPLGRARNFVASQVQKLAGTTHAGFKLEKIETAKWSPSLYALRDLGGAEMMRKAREAAPDPEQHNEPPRASASPGWSGTL